MIKVILMALLLQGNVMAKTEDELRREELEGFLRNFEQREDVNLPRTSGHRDKDHKNKSTNHEKYGAIDAAISHISPELQTKVLEEMASIGGRVIDERTAPGTYASGRGIFHVDSRTKDKPIKGAKDTLFEPGSIIVEDEKGKYSEPTMVKRKYVNEEKPEVLEARKKAEEAASQEEETQMSTLSIEDILSGKMMSEMPAEDMISDELPPEELAKKERMKQAMAALEEMKRTQASEEVPTQQAEQMGPPSPNEMPVAEVNPETAKAQMDAINKIKAQQPQEDIPAEPSIIDRLKEAQSQRDERQAEAMRLRGLQKIAQAGAVYADPNFKPDTSGADAMMKQANQIPADLLDELKAKGMIQSQEAASQKMSHEQMLNDPESEAALKGAEIMQKYGDEKGLGIDFSGTSVSEQKRYYDLYMKGAGLSDYQQLSLQIQKDRIEETKKNRGLREEKEDRTASQQQINTARGFMKDDPRMKKAVEQGMEFEAVDDLIEQARDGNQNALAALGTKLARAMGEVGVLTDTDVVRYVGGTSWGRQLKDYAARGYKGELSPETLDEMMNNMEMLRGKLRTDLNDVYDNAQKRMEAAYPDMDKEKISGIIGRPMIRESDDTVLMESPDGQQVRVKKDKVEKYKKKGAKVVQ